MNEIEKRCSGDKKEELFPEHSLIASFLRIGLRIEDLKQMTYVDAMKILISFLPEEKEEQQTVAIRDATQNDIDRFLR